MTAVRLLSRTDDVVTLRTEDYEALLETVEDALDLAALFEAGRRDEALGRVEARADNLPDALVGRLLEGENPVRVWRDHRGMTAAALADAAGMARSYVAEIETGRKPGSVAAYRALADVLRITVDDLV